MTSNLDVRLLGGGSPSAEGILADPKVAVIGFDLIVPQNGFSESSINLNVKINGQWGNGTGLKLSGKKISFSSSKGKVSKTLTPGVAMNVVIKMDVSVTNTVRYDFWINGEYCGYKSFTHTHGETNWATVGQTYVNLTVSRDNANVNTTRGMILDNIFIADGLPVGFTQN